MLKTKLKTIHYFYLLIFGFIMFGCAESETDKMNRELNEFISAYEQKVISLQEKYNMASYLASTTGNEDEYKTATELSIMLSRIYSNGEDYAILKKIKESRLITDTLRARELDMLYNLYLPYQIDEQKLIDIITLENEIKREYSTFRPVIDGEEVSDNKIEDVLKTSKDTVELEKYWRGSKKIGRMIDEKLIKLVKLRNEAAKALNFNNYYEMMLLIHGQDPKVIENVFNDLNMLTEDPYKGLKEQIDDYLAQRFKIDKSRLKPWHYQNRYFQKAPVIFDVDFDQYYKSKNYVSIVGEYFKGLGLNITPVYEKSDLFEKPGKSQLAFTTDIDRKGDVRISCNIINTEDYMTTFLYESGFAAYLEYIDDSLPYALHMPPQFAANDAVATLFSSMAVNPSWLEKIVGISSEEKEKIKGFALKQLQLEKFVFSRWAQVMYRFEKALYENPDQNLNQLWWDLVEKYQMIKKPSSDRDEPDWATKTHIVTMPCNYHNYMLGELIASQINSYINMNIVKGNGGCETKCINNPDIGKYMIEKLFKPGAKYTLNEWLKNATGEELSPEFFTYQYIKLE